MSELIALLVLQVLAGVVGANPAGLEQTDVFVSGTAGYHTYRIPAIVTSTKGTVLAFCEGRKNSAKDTGTIHLLLKRSTDGGKTWGDQQMVWVDGDNVCGNPAPVVDQSTGDIWLLMTWNVGSDGEREIKEAKGQDTRRVFVSRSTNDGVNWTKPVEITGSVKKPHWRWYATGPVNGIQLMRGPHRGRLVIPANHTDHTNPEQHPSHSHVIYSDDHGQTWQWGGTEDEMTNESTVVELSDGTLLQNMRSYHGEHRRAIGVSHDGGVSWSRTIRDEALIEPVCQASILRYSWPKGNESGRILFSNPSSTKREKMTVRLSEDEAATWPISKVLHRGPAAYSCLTVLPGGAIGCLYECGEKAPYERIVLARFPVKWLLDRPNKK
jgi:sialidase-1